MSQVGEEEYIESSEQGEEIDGEELPPYESESDYESEICYETFLTPTDSEKKSILAFAYELRQESTFCDVAFLVKGNLFRAHRIIVGSWSRWLRSLLSDGQEEEVVCLDMFTPDAFGSILDYMYGKPFQFSVDTAEGYMKILRRLEMQQLEQQCWQFLISAIDSTNCEKLHELADVFDCPPLKLCAWRILQESVPGYAMSPGRVVGADLVDDDDHQASYQLKGNGLTGPCDFDEDESEDEGAMPSIFPQDKFGEEEDENEDGGEEEEAEAMERDSDEANTQDQENPPDNATTIYASSVAGQSTNEPPPHPKNLPHATPAVEVVNGWRLHLDYIYRQCNAPSGTRFSRRGNRRWERSFRRRGRRREDDDSSVGSIQIRNAKVPENRGVLHAASRMLGLRSSETTPTKPSAEDFENKTVTLKDTVDWHAELTKFYEGIGMPNKVADLDNIMASWQGKEDLMIESLVKKYRDSLSSNRDLEAHLFKLLRYVHGQLQSRSPQMEQNESSVGYYDN